MQPIRRITGRGVPLDRPNIDTDQIIPSVWLKRVERTGFGEGLFAEWRADPDFVLNQPAYQGATILIAGPNFGCGSSREHAPWALEDYGFRAVIAPSFADIFYNNCLKIGLVPVALPTDRVRFLARCLEANPARQLTIDIAERTVTVPHVEFAVDFPLDEYHQHRFLEGLDDIAITLQHHTAIEDYEHQRHSFMPHVQHEPTSSPPSPRPGTDRERHNREGHPPDRSPRVGGNHVSDGTGAGEVAAFVHRRVQA